MKKFLSIFIIKQKIILVFWWVVLSIFITLFFKYQYYNHIYHGNFSTFLDPYMHPDSFMHTIGLYIQLSIIDILEVFLFIVGIYILLHKLMKINLTLLSVLTILLISLFGVLNYISIDNIGKLLSIDTLQLSIDWIQRNPSILLTYFTIPNFLFLGISLLLAFLPFMLQHFTYNTAILFLNKIGLYSLLSILFIVIFTTLSQPNKIYKHVLQGYGHTSCSSLLEKNTLDIHKHFSLYKLKNDYANLAYETSSVSKQTLKNISLNIEKKHIIIIGLETAPLKYYPIINNPDFPNFYKMCQSAIISRKHFTSTPQTSHASFSILTGLYPPEDGNIDSLANMRFQGLANILSESNYLTSYIDSFYIIWHHGDGMQKLLKNLGFRYQHDRDNHQYWKTVRQLKNSYNKELYAEKDSFNHALNSIIRAEKKDKKALIFLSTTLGHYPWKSKSSTLSNSKKLLAIGLDIDQIIGNFLDKLKRHNLLNNIIIIVTGDHGLRTNDECKSLHESQKNLKVAYNVPLIIYMPGTIKQQMELPYPTSHIDLTPTLLHLVGMDTSKYFFHGLDILNTSIQNRKIFLMNQRLKPFDSYYSKNAFYTYNNLTDESYKSICDSENNKSEVNYQKDLTIKQIIKRAATHFDQTFIHFLPKKNK